MYYFFVEYLLEKHLEGRDAGAGRQEGIRTLSSLHHAGISSAATPNVPRVRPDA